MLGLDSYANTLIGRNDDMLAGPSGPSWLFLPKRSLGGRGPARMTARAALSAARNLQIPKPRF
eukprot:14710556-Alexandrium_andersonii.AAC.1